MLNPIKLKSDFPIFSRQINDYPLVYLDNAATTQKPKQMIKSISDFYSNHNANIHRGVHTLSEEATKLYFDARQTVADSISAQFEEIIFTRNTTESLNLIAYTLSSNLKKLGKSYLLLLEMEKDFLIFFPCQIKLQFQLGHTFYGLRRLRSHSLNL